MHRREFVATMGTAAAVLSTAQVYVTKQMRRQPN